MGSSRKKVGVVLMVLAGSGLIIAGLYQLHISRRLAAEGRAASARVINKVFERRAKGGKSYYLELRYQAESGQTLLKRASVSEARYQRTEIGALVPLHYLPDDPAVFALGVEVKPDYSYLVIGAVFLFVAGLYHLFGRESPRRW